MKNAYLHTAQKCTQAIADA